MPKLVASSRFQAKGSLERDAETTIWRITERLLNRTPIPKAYRLVVTKEDLMDYTAKVIEQMTPEQRIETLYEVWMEIDNLMATYAKDWIAARLGNGSPERAKVTEKTLTRLGVIMGEGDGGQF